MKGDYGLFTRQRKRGKVWYFWYWQDDRRVFRSTGYGVREKWRARQKAEQFLAGLHQRGSARAPTLREYAADFFLWDRCAWIQRQHAKGRPFSRAVAQNRRSHLENHILPRFGELPLSELNPVDLEDWLISLPLANQTRNHILYTLNIILREAKRENMLAVNPLADVEALGVRHRRRDVLAPAELERLFPTNMRAFRKVWPIPYHGILYALMVSSGMRSGEVRAALWSAVSWEHSGVLILRAIQGKDAITLPKGNSQRAVLLPDRTMRLLRWWHDQTRYPKPGDLIFPGRDCQPLSRRTVSVQLAGGLRRAKIPTAGRNLVAHSLRHTYNTRMKELLTGELFEEFTGHALLRDFTGHHSEKMTQHYDNPHWQTRLESFGKARSQVERFWPQAPKRRTQ